MRLDARVRYEGFGRRLLAGLIDAVLLTLLVATVAVLSLVVGDEPHRLWEVLTNRFARATHAMWLLAALVSALAFFWTFLGATPGMCLLGCKVLRADSGRRLSLVQSCVRSVGLLLGLACLGIGMLWCIRDPRHQGLHDKLVGSVVVREDESLMSLSELVEGLK